MFISAQGIIYPLALRDRLNEGEGMVPVLASVGRPSQRDTVELRLQQPF